MNTFLPAVYLVGVTNLQPYFMQIVGHNSINLHRIPTKGIRFNVSFTCANFQLNQHILWPKMCIKAVEKQERIKLWNLVAHISKMAGEIYFKFGMKYHTGTSGFNAIMDHRATKV